MWWNTRYKVYFPKVYFPKVYFPKVYFLKVSSPKVNFSKVYFLAVHNSSIGLIVPCSDPTNNQSLHNITEWSKRLVTFETFDQTDFLEDFQIFWKIFRFLEDFQIFGRFSYFWKIFIFLGDFQRFGRFLEDFWKIFRFLEDFQIFGRFSDFWKIFRFLDNPRNFDIWDTVYNSDNWEPEFMTIFVIWQLIVTLDSIRNSCDVCSKSGVNGKDSTIHWMVLPGSQVDLL